MKRRINKRRSKNTKVTRRKKTGQKGDYSRMLRVAGKISGILAVLSLVYLIVYLAVNFLKLPEFPVRDIRIEGIGHLDHKELLRKVDISGNTNILTIGLKDGRGIGMFFRGLKGTGLKEIERKLLSEGCIAEAKVSRNFCTGTVSIKLKLREPVALISCDGIYGVDRGGVVIGGIDELSKSDLPLITGLDVRTVSPGEKLELLQMKTALEVLDYISLSNMDSFAVLSEINVGDLKNVVVYIGKEGIQIRLGKDSFNERINKSAMILADRRSRGEKTEYIDFRFGEKIIVKPGR